MKAEEGCSRSPTFKSAPAGLLKRAGEVLPHVNRILHDEYGTASLGNKQDPLDELVFIQLSIRTRERTYLCVYEELSRAVNGEWERLLEIQDADLLPVLHGAGMAVIKLRRLRAQIVAIVDAFGSATLEPLRSMSNEGIENFLRSLPGVGPKAARCVMLYSLGRPVFPVDSHCRRVLDRLGFLPAGIDRKAADDFLQVLVPAPLRHDLHVNLVHLGRRTCLPRQPRCSECTILHLCPTGLNRNLSTQ